MDRNISFPLTSGRRSLGFKDERTIRDAIFGSKDFVQRMKLDTTLDVHRGCVNTICWNEKGSLLLSGSDDKKLCFTDPHTRHLLASIPSGHRSNIFSAKFLPGSRDRQVVSCSGDGCINFNDLDHEESYGKNIFTCHYGTAYEVVTLPSDPNTFMSCGEDGTVRWFDLRIKNSCTKEECKEDVLINCRRAVTALSINPILPYHLAVGCSDSSVRIFDRRMLGTRLSGNYVGRGMQGILCRFCPAHLQNKYSRPTSLTYSSNGEDLLVSYSSDYIYLFGTNSRYQRSDAPVCRSEEAEDVGEDPLGDKDELTQGNPVKRLRLRGDWSDTGPKARPRSELPEDERPRPTIIQRMSEMLSRWLEDSSSRSPRSGNRPLGDSPSSSSSLPSPNNNQPEQATTGSAATQHSESMEGASNSADTQDASGQSTGSSSRAGRDSNDDVRASHETNKEMDCQPSEAREKVSLTGEAVSKTSSSDVLEVGVGSSSGVASEVTSGKTESAIKDNITEKESDRARRETDSDKASGPSHKNEGGKKATLSPQNEQGLDRDFGGSAGKVPHSGERSRGQRSPETLKPETSEDSTPVPQAREETKSTRDSSHSHDSAAEGQRSSIGDRGEESEMDSSSVGQTSKDDESKRSASDGTGVGSKTEAEDKRREEEDKKGIFALGERMEDREPQPRLTKQDSLEHTRTRRISVSGIPGQRPDSHDSHGTSEAGPSNDTTAAPGAEEKIQDGGSDRSRKQEKGDESEGMPSTSSRGAIRKQRSESSVSMTCSESDSDDDELQLGPEREKKSPHVKGAQEKPKERVRSEAELRLRELFRTRKDEREKEAQIMRNVYSPAVDMVYRGHRNSRTMIKEANFWGDHYIVSGSDCGHIFIWDRYTAELVMLLEGDKHVVNCIQPHPFDPILATSGIDYNIKLWTPLAEEPYFPDNAVEVMRINELMLEETRDTITVPPSFMLRMLASLNHLRSDRRRSQDPQSASESSDD